MVSTTRKRKVQTLKEKVKNLLAMTLFVQSARANSACFATYRVTKARNVKSLPDWRALSGINLVMATKEKPIDAQSATLHSRKSTDASI